MRIWGLRKGRAMKHLRACVAFIVACYPQRFYVAWCGAPCLRSRRYRWFGLLDREATAREEELVLRPLQQLRQLGDLAGNAPRTMKQASASSDVQGCGEAASVWCHKRKGAISAPSCLFDRMRNGDALSSVRLAPIATHEPVGAVADSEDRKSCTD
jgi:hypothetical protein